MILYMYTCMHTYLWIWYEKWKFIFISQTSQIYTQWYRVLNSLLMRWQGWWEIEWISTRFCPIEAKVEEWNTLHLNEQNMRVLVCTYVPMYMYMCFLTPTTYRCTCKYTKDDMFHKYTMFIESYQTYLPSTKNLIHNTHFFWSTNRIVPASFSGCTYRGAWMSHLSLTA